MKKDLDDLRSRILKVWEYKGCSTAEMSKDIGISLQALRKLMNHESHDLRMKTYTRILGWLHYEEGG